MIDVDLAHEGESPYECFECGTVVLSDGAPDRCPNCDGDLRNRRTPLE
ncbi:rubrerythrin-like domain-containing protein [Halorubrum sp. JWXQ-INN 858]|nr:rubrerythrin-like domain-containing protein [Halorubrum sp. JWXQ-INN 858]MWV64214.1 rubrerythrin-like domain-containing protein [Halorubrum sp. JWXQ-INN 858]